MFEFLKIMYKTMLFPFSGQCNSHRPYWTNGIILCAVISTVGGWELGKTFVELTRSWYGKAVGFPFSLHVPVRKQTASRTRLMSVFGSSCINDSELETLVQLPLSFFAHFIMYFYLIRNAQTNSLAWIHSSNVCCWEMHSRTSTELQ